MSTTDEFRAIVARLRSWKIDVVEHSGCYGRSNGSGWTHGRPVGHTNHHYVCSMNPEQSYIDSLVANLAAGAVVNWFADVNGRAYLLGTGPMNHAGTGNSSVLARTMDDLPNYSVAGSAGDMSGNQAYSGTECQHPGDSTPWPESLLRVMFAINAAEFLEWSYTANRAINHYAWTNRKIDTSWLGGVASDQNGRELVANVEQWMNGDTDGDWFDMATKDELKAAVREVLREDNMVSYQATNQGNGTTEERDVSVVKAIGDGVTYAGRAARAATLAQ